MSSRVTHQVQETALWFSRLYQKASRHSLYFICLFALSLPLHLLLLFIFIRKKDSWLQMTVMSVTKYGATLYLN